MSLFLSGECPPTGGVLPRYPATLYIYNKVKTTNANIKRYKEQVMTRAKKKDDDKTTSATGCPPASASQDDAR